MTEVELRDALDGLSAYDHGSTDSGIKDEALRSRCTEYLRSLPEDESRVLVGKITRDLFLTDEAMAHGYGLEDAVQFGTWMYDGGLGSW